MCGLAGCVRPSGGIGVEDVARMSGALVHRGPDDQGVWISPGGIAGLGHCRLSIIDLSPLGHQPMTNEDQSLWLVYNGEIYNFMELRSILESLGHRFVSRADSEVIVHAYEEWGRSCLERLNGIFAFALWDERSQSLFAARDRLGVKPFYYWVGPDGSFAFASQLKGLMQAPAFEAELDLESLWWYLTLRHVPSPRCILRRCATLPPGHSLTWRSERRFLETECYWSAGEIADRRPASVRTAATEEDLEALVRDAIRQQLVSDVPIGAFLSGGLDSTLVVACMAQAGARVKTFTIGFRDQVDEVPFARRVASHFGASHEEMYVTAEEMQRCIPELPDVFDEPLADSSVIPTLWLSRMTRRHVTVALSGDGGDELFGGYGWYADLMRMRPLTWIPAPLRRALAAPGRLLPWGKAQKVLNVLDFKDWMGLMRNITGCWRAPELKRLMPPINPGNGRLTVDRRDAPGCGALDRMLLHDLTTYLPDELLVKVDRAGMSVGLEVRVPLLDHRVVECALRLPPQLKIKGRSQKVVLRRILKRLVPDEWIDRPKRGFGAPLDSWLKGSLRWVVDQYLDERRIRAQGLFEPAVVKEAVDHFQKGAASHYRVWALIVFEMWAERYGIC